MEFSSSAGNFVIEDVGPDESGWITIKSQSVTYDKTAFYVEQFNNDFPAYNILGSNDLEKFNFLSELCARTPAMRKWFAATSILYSDTTQIPLYLKNAVAPSEFKRIQDKLLVLKDGLATVIQKRNDLARKYASDLDALRIEEQNIVKKTLGDDKVLQIINLKTEALPLSIQMKIQSYMPSGMDDNVSDSRRRLAQEYLAKFKVALIDLVSNNDNIDVSKIVEELELK
jgi:hypothetical protein